MTHVFEDIKASGFRFSADMVPVPKPDHDFTPPT